MYRIGDSLLLKQKDCPLKGFNMSQQFYLVLFPKGIPDIRVPCRTFQFIGQSFDIFITRNL
mgnify:CR=1 FL=1